MRQIAGLLIVVLLAVSGCATVKNKVEAQLMPEAVAKKKIIARYFGRQWAENPIGTYAQGFGWRCSGPEGWVPIFCAVLPFQT